MDIDAQIDAREVVLGPGDERGGVLPTMLAAGVAAGFERREQAFGKRVAGEFALDGIQHMLAHQHIAERDQPVAHMMAGEVAVLRPGTRGRTAARVDDAQLPVIGVRVGSRQRRGRRRCRAAVGQQVLRKPAASERVAVAIPSSPVARPARCRVPPLGQAGGRNKKQIGIERSDQCRRRQRLANRTEYAEPPRDRTATCTNRLQL